MVIVAVLLLLGFGLFASLTRAGIGWRATVTDPQMATSFGVDPVRVRYLNFLFGSALAGIAGGLVGLLNNYVEPTMGGAVSYKALAIIVLGGLGSVRGTLIASLVLGVVESFGAIYLAEIFDRDAIGFFVPDPGADDPAAGPSRARLKYERLSRERTERHRHQHDPGAQPQHHHRLLRPGEPGPRGFLRHRRLYRGLSQQAGLSAAGHVDGGRRDGGRAGHRGRAHVAARAARLPGRHDHGHRLRVPGLRAQAALAGRRARHPRAFPTPAWGRSPMRC